MPKDIDEVESDKIKLCDFGLATHVDVKEYLYKRCGTPGYVCPEVVNADANATHQSVIHVMEAARLAGLTHITFATQTTAK